MSMKPNYRMWQSELGFAWEVPTKCCCFCKHCTDIFYDITHGPYMFICDKELNYSTTQGCDSFVEEN